MIEASATYGSSSSPSLSPPSGTGSVDAGLASSVLWRAPFLSNVVNLLKCLEIWLDVSHSSLVHTFVPSAVGMDLIRPATSSAVALFLLPSPCRKTSRKNWRTLVVKLTDFLVFFSAKPMSAVGGASSDWLWETEADADVVGWAVACSYQKLTCTSLLTFSLSCRTWTLPLTPEGVF